MTWGTIEATPVVLRAAEADSAGGGAAGGGGAGAGGGGMGGPGAVGPFRVREADRREELAHRMARRAKRSLAESGASPRAGLALGGPGGGLRRAAAEASVRGSTPGGGGGRGGGGGTPSASARADALSPAARSLLGRTKPGRALEAGLGRTEAWREEGEERRRIERARQRAREVESRERLRRERWSVRWLSSSLSGSVDEGALSQARSCRRRVCRGDELTQARCARSRPRPSTSASTPTSPTADEPPHPFLNFILASLHLEQHPRPSRPPPCHSRPRARPHTPPRRARTSRRSSASRARGRGLQSRRRRSCRCH